MTIEQYRAIHAALLSFRLNCVVALRNPNTEKKANEEMGEYCEALNALNEVFDDSSSEAQ